jgi:hypothetical protein
MFLNELSCSEPRPREGVDDAMEGFVRLLRGIVRWRGDAAIVSGVLLKEQMELAPGYYLAEWVRSRPGNIDLWRFIRRMQNRAPFRDVLPAGAGDGSDYFHGGRSAVALGAAHLLDALLVSLLVDNCWDCSWLPADRELLVQTPDGDTAIMKDRVEVRHAATLEHATQHEEWIKRSGLLDLRSGSEIWERRVELYPDLQFLPRVQKQLHHLSPEWVTPVAVELRRLNDAIADWEPRQQRVPVWRSNVTAEAETRKRLCIFTDVDGVKRTFDLHGRFTPGKGRLHFRLVPEDGRARVAHIGPKLD